jgi:hypothetical protein
LNKQYAIFDPDRRRPFKFLVDWSFSVITMTDLPGGTPMALPLPAPIPLDLLLLVTDVAEPAIDIRRELAATVPPPAREVRS